MWFVPPARVRATCAIPSLARIANDYLDDAGLPHYSSQADLDLANAVTDEVSRRLRTPGRPFCTHGRCTFSAHDHTTSAGPDGQHLDREVPLCCAHCGHPAHYDTRLQDYRHDGPAVPDCFLIRRDTHGHTETSAGPGAAYGHAKPADDPDDLIFFQSRASIGAVTIARPERRGGRLPGHEPRRLRGGDHPPDPGRRKDPPSCCPLPPSPSPSPTL